MRLNLACGETRWEGWENSDIHGEQGTSILDLECFPYPYEDGSAELIMLSHALFMTADGRPMHPDRPRIFRECYRILARSGWLRIDDNPLRCYRLDERIPEEERQAEAERGYPPTLRIPRDKLRRELFGAGFTLVSEHDPAETVIVAPPEVEKALVGNHGSHVSFCLEARK